MSRAIRLEHITKQFRVPLDRSATLKYRLTHPRSTSRYRDLHALHDVSFEIEYGEFVGIIGANGCGKSTLLKILSRIYEPTSGRMEVNGMVSPFLELGVGFNPELTARENIYLNGAILGLTRAELDRRVDEIIDFAELADFSEQKLKNYSSGMQVRLAFSVAIQADAGILLMDEVLAVGDQRFQEKCFDVFARYKRQGRTVILVTHDLSAVDLYCDRAILLDHGNIIDDGTATDVVVTYRRRVGQQADSDPVAPQDEEVTRWGSREVEILAIRLVDDDGNQHRNFTSGRPMVIETDYLVRGDVGSFVSGFSIDRADGLGVAGTNTIIDHFAIDRTPPGSSGTIRYRIPDLPLLQGSYAVGAAIVDEHHTRTFDRIERAVPFHVTDESGRVGIIALGGGWSVEHAVARRQAV